MARLIQRDVQKSKCYAWERLAYRPDGKTPPSLHSREVIALVERVHADVIARGGYAHHAPVVKFTKRTGYACARWGHLNFTRGQASLDTVLHEIAHSLTWCPAELRAAHAQTLTGRALSAAEQHILRTACNQGHGPRYLACFIALMERYAGFDIGAPLILTAGFDMAGWGPWQRTPAGTGVRSDGTQFSAWAMQRTRVTKRARLQVDTVALQCWRWLLGREIPAVSS